MERDPETGHFLKGNKAQSRPGRPKQKRIGDFLKDIDIENASVYDVMDAVARVAISSNDTDTQIKGANLAAKVASFAREKEKVVVSPFARGILALFNSLEDNLGIPGMDILNRMTERVSEIAKVLK